MNPLAPVTKVGAVKGPANCRLEVTLATVRIAGHLFQPVADPAGIFGSCQRWLTAGQPLVEVPHHRLQAVVATQTAGGHPGQAERHLPRGRQAFLQGIHRALRMLWQASLALHGHGHTEAIHSQHSMGSLDQDHVLQRPHVPGQVDLGRTLPAAEPGAPFVELQVGVLPLVRQPPLHVQDFTQKGLHLVEGMNPQIAERKPPVAIVGRQTPSASTVASPDCGDIRRRECDR